MQNAVIVLGYNNIRIYDVKKIKERARQHLNAITVLCKQDPTETDREAVDHVIDVGLEATTENANKVVAALERLSITAIAFLPFSDPGTQLAGALAHHFKHLRCPDPYKIQAALDKFSFRTAEALSSAAPDCYKKVKSWEIHSLKELQDLHREHHGKVFLKPAKEGNSKGCINLHTDSDLTTAWNEVSQYASEGIVLEELISGGQEYSWDHVNGYSWITEKKTNSNRYNTEFQHIVPAPLSKDAEAIISNTGRFMAELSGYNNGACHNEIFYFEETKNASAVEPNLRPGGGRIWDLAALAFEDFDPWTNWILWAAGKTDNNPKKLTRKYYAGIRKIQAIKSGHIEAITPLHLADFTTPDFELVELTWVKKIGDPTTATPKDNSDYLGYIIGRSKTHENLNANLKSVTLALQQKVIIN